MCIYSTYVYRICDYLALSAHADSIFKAFYARLYILQYFTFPYSNYVYLIQYVVLN